MRLGRPQTGYKILQKSVKFFKFSNGDTDTKYGYFMSLLSHLRKEITL
jgi:hypothetical protein